jgi:hypothetical protein
MPGKEDQEKKSVEEQNHVIKENYVSQNRNFMSYMWNEWGP